MSNKNLAGNPNRAQARQDLGPNRPAPDAQDSTRPASLFPSGSSHLERAGGLVPARRAPLSPRKSLVPAKSDPRARLLQRICECVDRRRARGQSLHRALRSPVWYWKQRTYKNGKPVRFSEATLTRAYYAWVAAGRATDAFTLRYKVSRKPISSALKRALIQANTSANVRSMRAAFRKISQQARNRKALKGVSARVLIESLPPEVRTALRKAHAERRELAAQCDKVSRQVKKLANQFHDGNR